MNKFLSIITLFFSISSMAALDMKSGGQDELTLDISGGNQVFTIDVTSLTGGERINRTIRAGEGLSIDSSDCDKLPFTLNQTCTLSLTANQLTSADTSTVVIKYIEGSTRQLEIFKVRFLKNSGVNLHAEFGANQSGTVEFNSLNILQSSKKRVKITNRGNTVSPKIAKLETDIHDKAITLIGDTCSGQTLEPKESCFLKLKVDSSKLFSGTVSGSINFLNEEDGASIFSLPLSYDVTADRISNNNLSNVSQPPPNENPGWAYAQHTR